MPYLELKGGVSLSPWLVRDQPLYLTGFQSERLIENTYLKQAGIFNVPVLYSQRVLYSHCIKWWTRAVKNYSQARSINTGHS
jgi:hypothetical protein